VTAQVSRLTRVFATLDSVLVAVSGGVDSMTLAHVVDRHFGTKARMVHAVSPAVPPQATVRVREHAVRRGWALSLVDAGEFADPRYRANPVNRCYFCKSNLYGHLADRFGGLILSGTNTDDLGDYRPGLRAASEHGVRHPFVEAGFSKADIRALAHGLGLADLADLPAAPCLASRVETGIAIKAADLALIDEVENCVRSALGAVDVRCRVTARGVRLELGGEALEQLLLPIRGVIRATVAEIIAGSGRPFLGFAPYRRGSAFLRDQPRV
jgi:pyridinium-3,5-biscarboxylic acid mononucleotide sulfurtransferase